MQTTMHLSTAEVPRPRRTRALILAVFLVLIAACSKNSSPTSPYGGGGGGGGGGGNPGTLFNLGPFAIGQSIRHDFAAAGNFGYHCIPHQAMGMVGNVQVDGTGADSLVVQVGAGGFIFAPGTAHIKPGGYVRWVNVSNLAVHTVTSDN